DARTERLDRVSELRVAAEKLRGRVRHLEGRGRPAQRPVQRRKEIVVDTGERAGKRAVQVASALEQMKRAVEVAVTADAPRFVLEEQLAHAREVHTRLHL